MARLVRIAVPVIALLASTSSHALVRELSSCTTNDGQYHVSIEDNQGLGPIRASHVAAIVRELPSGEVVASYTVKSAFLGSISFGRTHYRDTRSGGQNFDLAFPSTNAHNTTLSVKLQAGDHRDTVLSDEQMKCVKIF
jgi:hypothetical protein